MSLVHICSECYVYFEDPDRLMSHPLKNDRWYMRICATCIHKEFGDLSEMTCSKCNITLDREDMICIDETIYECICCDRPIKKRVFEIERRVEIAIENDMDTYGVIFVMEL